MNEHNMQMSENAARKLSDSLMRRRVELGIRSARQMGQESGLDYRTITGLESRRRAQVSRNTLAILEMQLQWPSGYLVALIEGSDAPVSEVVEISVPDGASESTVRHARAIAQAAFNAAVREMGDV
jgi:hypothetical protein